MATIAELTDRVRKGTASDTDRAELAKALTSALEAVELVSSVAEQAGIRLVDAKSRATLADIINDVGYHVHLSAYSAHMRSRTLARATKYLADSKLPQPEDWAMLVAWAKNPTASKLPADLHSAIREGFRKGDARGQQQHGKNIKV